MQPTDHRPLSLLLLACALACAPTPDAPEAPAPAAQAPIVATPVVAAATAKGKPLTGPPVTTAPVAGDERFTGRVLERLPAGPSGRCHGYLLANGLGGSWHAGV